MQCDEARSYLVELVYESEGAELAQEFRDHFAVCSECPREYLRLLETRRLLAQWPDEEPAKNLVFVPTVRVGRFRSWIDGLRAFRPATALAFGLVALLAFLAFANVKIQWQEGRFVFQSGVFSLDSSTSPGGYGATGDLLSAVDRMLTESEERQIRQTLVLLQRAADTMEYRRQADLLQVRDDMGLLQRNYYQALERNSVLLEEAAKLLQQNRY